MFDAAQTRGTISAKLAYVAAPGKATITVTFGIDGAEQSVWWEIAGPPEQIPGKPVRHDLALVALIFLAMRKGRDLHIAGPVSRSLLENVERFVRIWSAWRPDAYSVIAVSADEEVANLPPGEREAQAVCAFSGGVDATCSVWRHSSGMAGRASRAIGAGVLVQGFDIPLDNDEAFETTKAFCKAMLDDLGIPLVTVRTNWKRDISGEWGMEFGAGIVACLKPWEETASTLIVGSCEDYSRLVTPWGSHPLPTHLLAANDTQLPYDGGDLNRTQKVREISAWPVGYDNLRVCWQGEITGKNCGVCEKCVRTKLNAIISSKPLPKSLAERPTFEQVSGVRFYNDAQRLLFEELLTEANASGSHDPLVPAIVAALAKPNARRKGRFLRRFVRKGRSLMAGLPRRA